MACAASSSSSIPSAPVYTCNPEPADAGVGCRAPSFFPNAPKNANLYPEGCMVTLPVMSGAAPGLPLQCTCQLEPMAAPDGGFARGLEFLCAD
jgi:hypothetical protein